MNRGIADRFAGYLKPEKGRSDVTINNYRPIVERFLQWVASQGYVRWDDTGLRELQGFFESEAKRMLGGRRAGQNGNRKPQARYMTTAAIKAFYGFLVEERLASNDLGTGLDYPKKDDLLPKPLSHEQIQRLLAITHPDPRQTIRDSWTCEDRVLIEPGYSCGLRISELRFLTMADVRLDERVLMVSGKRGRQRLVPFGRKAFDQLKLWLETCRPRRKGTDRQPYVLLNAKGRPYSAVCLWRRFKEIGEREGIASLHPHQLRHTFATHLL